MSDPLFTVDSLDYMRAPREVLEPFRRAFPGGVRFDLAGVRAMEAAGVDVVWIAASDMLSADMLDTLALSDDPRVRREVVVNKRITSSTLFWLSLDEDADVRLRVAQHPSTDNDMLRRLADEAPSAIGLCARGTLRDKESRAHRF